MAQPQQAQQPSQFQPSAYASPTSTPSPMTPGAHAPYAPPAAKQHPQLSPNTPTGSYPRQGVASPTVGTNGNHAGYNPYAQQNINPYPLHNTPSGPPPARQTSQAYPPPHPLPQPAAPNQFQAQPMNQPPAQAQTMAAPAQGAMPPPAAPEHEKAPDINDLSDVMYGAGVDLRAEEQLVSGQFQQRRNFDPHRNLQQSNVPGGPDSFYGGGTFNQPATTEARLRNEAEAKRREALKLRNERAQYHLNDSFLQSRIVMHKIHTAAQRCQSAIDMTGVFQPTSGTVNTLKITGPEGQDRIATLTREPLLATHANMVDVLALISLAARERIRTVVEDAATLVRGRNLTSTGVIPPDFQDIAFGLGKTKEATGLPLPLIGDALSPNSNPLKRSHSEANELPTPVSNEDPTDKPEPIATVAYSDLIAEQMQKDAEEEDRLERERVAKRVKRQTANLVSSTEAGSRTNSIAGTPAPGTPGPDSVAPDQSKLTKKELKKRQDADAASTAALGTKNAVSMALGGSKKPSWMTGGKPGSGGVGSGTSFGKRPFGAPAKKDKPAQGLAAGAAGKNAATAKPKNPATDRADKATAPGIEMRDVISVLKDTKTEKKTLSKAYYRLDKWWSKK